MKRRVDIEKLLRWAYREELAKLEFTGFNWMTDLAELGVRVDEQKDRGDAPSGLSQGYAAIWGNGIDPDARAIHLAVSALGKVSPEWEEPELLLADMPEEVQGEASAYAARYSVQLGVLVMRCARIGSRPAWRAECPEKKPVLARNSGKPAWFVKEEVPLYGTEMEPRGAPATNARGSREAGPNGGRKRKIIGYQEREVDGYDKVSKRVKAGAYQKFYFDPDVGLIVDQRADWCCWHAALESLCETLNAEMRTHEALPPSVPRLPWVDGEGPSKRVLPAFFRAAA